MRLIEGGDRRIQDFPTMEEVTAVILIEYSDKGFRLIVLALRSSNRNDRFRRGRDFEQYFQLIGQTRAIYVCTIYALILHHGTYWRH
jgi:hypothetical protein